MCVCVRARVHTGKGTNWIDFYVLYLFTSLQVCQYTRDHAIISPGEGEAYPWGRTLAASWSARGISKNCGGVCEELMFILLELKIYFTLAVGMNSSQVEDSAYILSGIFPSLGTRPSIFQRIWFQGLHPSVCHHHRLQCFCNIWLQTRQPMKLFGLCLLIGTFQNHAPSIEFSPSILSYLP